MNSNPHQSEKLLGLEVLRFLSALAVLVWHYQHFYMVGNRLVGFERENQPLYALFKPFYEHGYNGVQIFWCISGFIFMWKYRQPISDGAVSAGRFFVLRFSRLYPLHGITLLTVMLLQSMSWAMDGRYFVYQNNDVWHFALQLFFASHWGLEKGGSFNGPVWSISVEVLVYFLFFFVLRLAGSSAWVNIAIVLGCIVARAFGIVHSVLDCLQYFYGGALAAIVYQHCKRSERPNMLRSGVAVVLVVAPILLVISGGHRDALLKVTFLVIWLPALLFFLAHPVPASPVQQRYIETAGNLTYASYLLHFPLQLAIVLGFRLAGAPVPTASAAFCVLYLAATLVLAAFTYRAFEMPTQNWLRQRMT